ncbi:polysaccharide pyruvyl transferase family protein [Levilactobacillus brevis]|uniref:polysaccharide pyruvyl transferase family protein n=1 Tax=Levilactobacillus brevis TaxID=1580 RepID=UPI0012BCD77C
MLDAILRRLGLPSVTALVGRFRFKDFIEIGGSIFMEEENWLEKYRERVYIQKHCISYSVLGSNFGPYSSPEFKQRYEQFFDSVTQVVFRDRYSKQLFETNNNISWGPDLKFCSESSRGSSYKRGR